MIGRTGHSILLTVVDRLSWLTLIKKVVQKDSQEINKGLVELLGAIPKEFVHSITPDHGTEFLHLDEISERLGVTVYWPDPYSPEQRGTNENTNGLIREYFPKRTDIDNYTEQDVEHCQKQLNQRPRKVLNYETANCRMRLASHWQNKKRHCDVSCIILSDQTKMRRYVQ